MPALTFQKAVELARQLAGKGEWAEAEAVFYQILGQLPGHAESWHQLGLLALRRGDASVAIAHFDKAIAAAPDRVGYHMNIAVAQRALGQFDPAAESYRTAGRLAPDWADVAHHLGATLLDLDEVTDAIESFRRAVVLDPGVAEYHTHLGIALDRNGFFEEAAEVHRRAISLRSDLAIAHTHLGNSLFNLDRFEEAVACHQEAVIIEPSLVTAHNNLGVVLRALGDIEGSVDALRHAIKIVPENVEAHLNLAQTLLLAGRYAEGWTEYEWRVQLDPVHVARAPFSQPLWDGAPHPGETLFVWSDQGFGDIIQFSRYLAFLDYSGMRIVLGCRPALRRLQESIPGIAVFVSEGEPLPTFDRHLPISRLPFVLRDRVTGVSAAVPYLAPPQDAGNHWRERLARPGFRVGLVWAGQPLQRFDRRRSLTISALAPIFSAVGDRGAFFSLQKGDAVSQLVDSDLPIIDLSADLHDFAETAAAIGNLDLIISVDTAVAHLAGSLGRQVWTLISSPPDWRWQINREDSDWYPTMRLFRQSRPGDWSEPIQRAADALRKVAGVGPGA